MDYLRLERGKGRDVPEESPHAEYDVLGQGRKDLGREDVRQGATPTSTSGRDSDEQAVLARAKSHAASNPSTQTIAASSLEVISDAAQQPQVHPAESGMAQLFSITWEMPVMTNQPN
ncbi:hypothetical protein CEP54_016363 [Fusarium duplospermum]|uniref:Uncharacterized protein n=1 Tax=Fusarium duplospermum TaxID=1325734 RepID=A0A428NEG4_9HYPO|nr:hypothetical protein CEP54_016363 [Fusarium duplospermum]